MKNKKAQSEIISTVLLILIAITAIVVVSSFVIPFIKKQLSGTDCLDVSGKIEIKNNPAYTCYDADNKELRVQVHMGDTGNLTKGFQLSLEVDGSSKSFEIVPGANMQDVRMFGEPAPVQEQQGEEQGEEQEEIPELICNPECGENKICLENNVCECIEGYELVGGVCEEIVEEETECQLTNAYWSKTTANKGEEIKLIVEGVKCINKEISFEIFEDDGGFGYDDSVSINPGNIYFSENTAEGVWTAEYQNDVNGNPEYYFVAKLKEDEIIVINSKDNDELTVKDICTPETNIEFCSRLGKTCGSVTDNDNCGTSRTANCGTCSSGQTCSGGKCVCVPDCSGKQCGDDGCGGNCGTCTNGKLCQNNLCVCPDSCASLGYSCGTQTICGESKNCGTCASGKTCSNGKCVIMGYRNADGNCYDEFTFSFGGPNYCKSKSAWKIDASNFCVNHCSGGTENECGVNALNIMGSCEITI